MGTLGSQEFARQTLQKIYRKFQDIADITVPGQEKLSKRAAHSYFSPLISTTLTSRQLENVLVYHIGTTPEIACSFDEFKLLLQNLAPLVYPEQSPGIAYALFLPRFLSSRGTKISPLQTTGLQENPRAPSLLEREPLNASPEASNLVRYFSQKSPSEKRRMLSILVPLFGIPFLLFGRPQSSTALVDSPANNFLRLQNLSTTPAQVITPQNVLENQQLTSASKQFWSQPLTLVSSNPERSKLAALTKESSSFQNSYVFPDVEKSREQLLQEVYSTKRSWIEAGSPLDEEGRLEHERAIDAFLKFTERADKEEMGQQERLAKMVQGKRRELESAVSLYPETSKAVTTLKSENLNLRDAYMKSIPGSTFFPTFLMWGDADYYVDAKLREVTRKEWIKAGFPASEFDDINKLYQTSLKDAFTESLQRKSQNRALKLRDALETIEPSVLREAGGGIEAEEGSRGGITVLSQEPLSDEQSLRIQRLRTNLEDAQNRYQEEKRQRSGLFNVVRTITQGTLLNPLTQTAAEENVFQARRLLSRELEEIGKEGDAQTKSVVLQNQESRQPKTLTRTLDLSTSGSFA